MAASSSGNEAQTAPLIGAVESGWRHPLVALRAWFDTSSLEAPAGAGLDPKDNRIDLLRVLPFIAMHIACIAVFWVGVSAFAVGVAVGLYAIRMFALTGFYPRYFSHRSFRTSRTLQFVFAVIGASSVQRGPLWWAAHHRNHHQNADTALDPHSPTLRGFVWSHVGWFLTPRGFRTDWKRIPDLARYPELRWLDRYDILVPILLAVALFGLGIVLHHVAPGLGTSGGQLVTWGFFISTTVLFHATVTINSLAHRFGTRRFPTPDDSRNNVWLALITFGEGWHNNHHFFPSSTRQGFAWYELDLTYYGLRLLEAVGLVRNLRPIPARVVERVRG
jgi:stearoyl-CoA desaturase (delta-9 desaturase)